MENETNEQQQTKSKGKKFLKTALTMFAGALILILIFGTYISYNNFKANTYLSGYTKASIDEANYTSLTGQIFYLMNTSDAKSINSTTITQIQYDAIASCVKSKVCTWNQTKYDELSKK